MANITVGSSYQQSPPATLGRDRDRLRHRRIGRRALLAKHGGKRVLVLERHYVAGDSPIPFIVPGTSGM